MLVDASSFAGGRALARKVGAGIEYYLNGAKYGERENVEVVLVEYLSLLESALEPN